jgi:geranylgeranyl diphosphate synthase type I
MVGYEMCGGTLNTKSGTSRLDGVQGGSEQRTEAYMQYGKGAAELPTKQSAKSGSGVAGSAGQQAAASRGTRMIVEAARAIEMLHAHLLIIDDIQDRSAVRRSGPSAHAGLAEYHRTHKLSGESEHFGVSIAINAALAGCHAALEILVNLDVSEGSRLKLLDLVNRTMLTTIHGQTHDIMNEVIGKVSVQQAEDVLGWKTAHYSFLSPLHAGMILAGASQSDLKTITPYAINVGKAFQIRDDIISTFGSEENIGKSPMDDIKEGKRTLLTVYALENAKEADRKFLQESLGNQNLTQAAFERCKDILKTSGALDQAKKIAQKYVREAIGVLDGEGHRWSADGVQFLHGLASKLLDS